MKIENSCIVTKNQSIDQSACQSTCPKVTNYLKNCFPVEKQWTIEAINLYKICGVYPCSVIDHLSACMDLSTKQNFIENAKINIP
ncbi:MAG TPA: hypothetical protein VJB63_03295 [Patescibacteria group bacterium]|nr:hypothetical protein [Patescibacteria group bacterium]